MNPSRYAKNLLKRWLAKKGYEIFRRPYLPKGVDVFESLRAHWPQFQPTVIFDVGANVGQTVIRLRPYFPQATIHSFEPIPATFAALLANVGKDSRVQCHPLALADRAGETAVQLHGSSEHNSLSPALRGTPGTAGPVVSIALETAAGFCARQNISHIDLLKIDVEGFELEVFKGASPLFAAGAVDYIVAEAGLMPGHPRFTPLPAMIELLRPQGFWLVGVYEQFGSRYLETAECCNVLFAHERKLTRSPASVE
jgi:FkbM family methyltransferase